MITKSQILELLNTESQILKLLNTDPRVVELAMVILHDRTPADDEHRRRAANGDEPLRGFSTFFMERGSRYARWVREGRSLTGDDLIQARKIAISNRKQLIDALNEYLGYRPPQ